MVESQLNVKLVQLEISVEKLEWLFVRGELCAAEIHCLNCQSKKHVWDLCLRCCVKRANCRLIETNTCFILESS